jgi:hypothetical protein
MKLQAPGTEFRKQNANIARLKREEEEADAWRHAQTSATPAPSSYNTLTDAFKSPQRPAHQKDSALTTATDSRQEESFFLQQILRIRKQDGFVQDVDDDGTKAAWLI